MIGVSVLSHNYGQYLHRALSSIKLQSLKPDVVIVMDDASSDTTKKVTAQYDAEYHRVTYKNPYKARNAITKIFRAKGFSRSDAILFLDADDWMQEDCLREMWDRINTGYDVAYSSMKYVSQHGFKSPIITGPCLRGQSFNAAELQRVNFIGLPSMVRFSHVVPFNEEFKREQDWMFWREISKNTNKFIHLDKELIFCWVHPDSITHRGLELASQTQEEVKPEVKEPVFIDKTDVLIAVPYWGPSYGGGELTMLSFARKLIDAGLNVRVAARHKRLQQTKGWWDDVPCVTEAKIEQEIANDPPRLVLFQDVPAPEEWMACKANEVPYVIQFAFWHNLVPHVTKDDWNRIRDGRIIEEVLEEGRRGLWGAAAVFANSEWMKERLQPLIPSKEIKICHPPLSEKATFKGKKTPKIVLMPQAQEGKGMSIFLKLAQEFTEEKFVALNPMGRFSSESESLLDKLPNVELVDWVDNIGELYKKSKCVFIGTQTAETFCRAAGEARAGGIPLLVSDAGNLVNFCKSNKNGQVVKYDAEYPEWRDAFIKVLKLKGKSPVDKQYLSRDGEKSVIASCASQMVGKSIAVVYPELAPGVKNACFRLWATAGVQPIPTGDLGRFDSSLYSHIILAGGFLNEYKSWLQSNPKVEASIWWCSSEEQMRWHPGEFDYWQKAIDFVRDSPKSFIFTTAPETAKSVAHRVGGRAKWLPCPFPLADSPMPWLLPAKEDPKGCVVPLLGPFSCRKRQDAVIRATRKLGGSLRISKKLFDRQDGKWMFADWNAQKHPHKVMDLKDMWGVFDMLGKCNMAAFPAAAETFGYAALESMLCSLPTISTRDVPIARYNDPELRKRLQLEGHTDSAVDTDLIRKMRWLSANPEDAVRLGESCRDHAIHIVEKNNNKAQRVIQELSCVSA